MLNAVLRAESCLGRKAPARYLFTDLLAQSSAVDRDWTRRCVDCQQFKHLAAMQPIPAGQNAGPIYQLGLGRPLAPKPLQCEGEY